MMKMRMIGGTIAILLMVLPVLVSAQAVDKPTWTSGDTWTIRQGKQTTIYTVLGPAEDGYSVQVKTDADSNILRYDSNLVSATAHFLRLQWPLEPGKQWSYQAPFRGHTYALTEKVVGPDSVSTPAGTFEAVHVQGRSCYQPNECGVFDLWYVPKVRFFAKITFAPGYWFDHNMEELIAYQVH